jgi:hypothetical protein
MAHGLLIDSRSKKKGVLTKQNKEIRTMKKILAILAIVSVGFNAAADEGKDNSAKRTGYKATDEMKDAGKALEDSYKGAPNPARPFVGTLTSPLGNTVQYIAEGVAILGQEGVESMVKAVVRSGRCIKASADQQPGIFAGCVLKLGGDSTIVIVNTVGYSAANLVDLGGEVLSDLAYIWRDAAYDLEGALREAGVPVLPGVAHVVGFVLDATGKVVEVTFGTIATGVRGATEGVALTVENVVDVPVSLLAGNGTRAGQSLSIGVGAAACTAIDLVITTPIRLFLNLVNLVDEGNRSMKSCMDQAKEDFRAIRNGTYKAPERSPYEVTP